MLSLYYKILEVTPGCSRGEVKSAYMRLAKKYHPDKNGDGEEKFKEIKNAYEILVAEFQRSATAPSRSNHARRDRSTFDGNTCPKPQALFRDVVVSLEELYSGTTKTVEIERLRACKSCSGRGDRDLLCAVCHGQRFIINRLSPFVTEYTRCPSPVVVGQENL